MSHKRRSFAAEYKVEAAYRVIDSGRTIAAVARKLGINEAPLGRWVADERRRMDAAAATGDELVESRFDRSRVDAVWTTDITYLTSGDGDMYLCAIKDEHSKKLLGWSIADHMRTEMVIAALDMVIAARGSNCAGTIVHSDRGTQFTATAFAQTCDRYGLLRSMGATGICWDNAGAKTL